MTIASVNRRLQDVMGSTSLTNSKDLRIRFLEKKKKKKQGCPCFFLALRTLNGTKEILFFFSGLKEEEKNVFTYLVSALQ